MQCKKAAIAAATSGDNVSYANLFNPLSQIMGGGDRYPEFMAKMLPDNPKLAWMLSKVGASALLAAALFGGTRLALHLNRVSEMADKDNPARSMRSDIGTTFEVPLSHPAQQRKQASVQEPPMQAVAMPAALSIADNALYAGIPTAAFLLAAAQFWKAADTFADHRRNRLLTEAIKGKSNTIRDLMQARARLAKGTISDKELDKVLDSVTSEDNYVKTASADQDPHPTVRKVTTGLGLLLAALGIATAVGSYTYFAASDPNNIKYKAMKKGLHEYARNKTTATPVAVVPTDAAEYFSKIDEGAKKKDVRELPEISPEARPISITL